MSIMIPPQLNPRYDHDCKFRGWTRGVRPWLFQRNLPWELRWSGCEVCLMFEIEVASLGPLLDAFPKLLIHGECFIHHPERMWEFVARGFKFDNALLERRDVVKTCDASDESRFVVMTGIKQPLHSRHLDNISQEWFDMLMHKFGVWNKEWVEWWSYRLRTVRDVERLKLLRKTGLWVGEGEIWRRLSAFLVKRY